MSLILDYDENTGKYREFSFWLNPAVNQIKFRDFFEPKRYNDIDLQVTGNLRTYGAINLSDEKLNPPHCNPYYTLVATKRADTTLKLELFVSEFANEPKQTLIASATTNADPTKYNDRTFRYGLSVIAAKVVLRKLVVRSI